MLEMCIYDLATSIPSLLVSATPTLIFPILLFSVLGLGSLAGISLLIVSLNVSYKNNKGC